MFKGFWGKNQDLLLVGGVISILLILFAPIPPSLLDVLIILNFGFGLTILLLTFYVNKPVEFSTFPSLLLVTTLFRLALNVAATRLILTGANAGEVIGSIGAFAVQGNFVIGLVVFFILVVVQYVVVTAGAQRVSEVAARYRSAPAGCGSSWARSKSGWTSNGGPCGNCFRTWRRRTLTDEIERASAPVA